MRGPAHSPAAPRPSLKLAAPTRTRRFLSSWDAACASPPGLSPPRQRLLPPAPPPTGCLLYSLPSPAEGPSCLSRFAAGHRPASAALPLDCAPPYRSSLTPACSPCRDAATPALFRPPANSRSTASASCRSWSCSRSTPAWTAHCAQSARTPSSRRRRSEEHTSELQSLRHL